MYIWTIKKTEIEVWPKRTLNRLNPENLKITFADFAYTKKLAINQEKRARVN